MRKIRIIEHISLDGVIQAPGGPDEDRDGDFEHGGWVVPHSDPAVGEAIVAAHGKAFDLLLGRRVYDIWSGYWPKIANNPMADSLNAATKYVATHRPDSLGWGPVEALGADVVEGVRRVKAKDGPDMIVWGKLDSITYPNLAGDVAVFLEAAGTGKADVFGYLMGAIAGLRLAIDYPEKVDQLVVASGAYDVRGWQPAFSEMIPQMTVKMITAMPMAEDYKALAPYPEGFPALAEKLIALEKEPMAWGKEVAALDTPVLIIAGDADVSTLEHNVEMFRLLGGGVMGDMGKPLPASRLAILPATSHTAVIGQHDLMMQFIGPFLAGKAPKGWFD